MLLASRQNHWVAWAGCALLLLMGAPNAQARQPTPPQIVNEGASTPVVAFSLLEDGLTAGMTDGGGIITEAPLFVDPYGLDGLLGTLDDDLRLQAGSPAIDGGDTDALPPDGSDGDNDGDIDEALSVDLDGNVRVVDGGSGTAQVDLGPYEYSSTPVDVETAPEALPASYVLTAAYPNPFNPQTTLHFRLRHAEPIRITLYDLIGRERRVLYEGTPAPGQLHTLRVDGSGLPSGMYLVHLTGKGIQANRPIMLVK